MKKSIAKVKVLLEALPYIEKFSGKTVVIKYGGSTMLKDELKESFARDVVLMKYVGIDPVIVHGGGPQIGELLTKLGKKTKFVNGIRVTDSETMDVVEMVLGGKINKEIVGTINSRGGRAVGLSGKDGGLINARKAKARGGVNMGCAGEIVSIDPEVIDTLDHSDFIPVISPVGGDASGNSYNINADIVAGEIAVALGAEKLILLSDIKGVQDKKGELLSSLTLTEARKLIKDKVAVGGMIPKLNCCIDAVKKGVTSAHIVDGRVEHSVLLEVFTDAGMGTVLKSRRAKRRS